MRLRAQALKMVCGALLGGCLAGAALAAEDTLPAAMARPAGYPAGPLTMIVPYQPGGGSARTAAAMADAVSALTGVEIVLDHRPGDSGLTGLADFMARPADGTTVLEHIDDLVIDHVFGSTEVDPARDLVPLAIAQVTFSQIYLRGGEDRFTDWASFVAYARAHGGVTVANVSREGSMERVSLERIARQAGIEIRQVSIGDPDARFTALALGEVDALFEQPGDVRAELENGAFEPILTLLEERPAAFADVPCLADVGLDFEPLLRFRGFFVRAGVPEDRLAWLQWAFQKAWFQPDYQAFNATMYMDQVDSFRDTEGALVLMARTAEAYRKAVAAVEKGE